MKKETIEKFIFYQLLLMKFTLQEVFTDYFLEFQKKYNCVLENKILVKRSFLSNLDKNKNKISLSATRLIKSGMKNISNFSLNSILNTNLFFNYNATSIFYFIKNHGLICRGFLLHPVIIKPKKKIDKLNGFLDHYIVEEYVNSKKIFIIDDANLFFKIGIDQNITDNFFDMMQKSMPKA